MDAGHDLFLATDSDASDELRELAADLGVDFDVKGSVVTDHFNRHDQGSEAILITHPLANKAVFGSQQIPVTFLCWAHGLAEFHNNTTIAQCWQLLSLSVSAPA